MARPRTPDLRRTLRHEWGRVFVVGRNLWGNRSADTVSHARPDPASVRFGSNTA